MNIDMTSENVAGNISILKLPAKGYRELLGQNIPYKIVKRTTDVVLSSVAMVVLIPIFTIISHFESKCISINESAATCEYPCSISFSEWPIEELYIKNLEISDIGSGYGEYNTYLCISGESNYIKAGKCQFYILKNSDGTYNIEIRNTGNGDKICKFDDFECAYDIVAS